MSPGPASDPSGYDRYRGPSVTVTLDEPTGSVGGTGSRYNPTLNTSQTWIVMILLLACTGLSAFDLYLLGSGLQ